MEGGGSSDGGDGAECAGGFGEGDGASGVDLLAKKLIVEIGM